MLSSDHASLSGLSNRPLALQLIRKTVKHLDMYHFLEEVFELSLERVLLRFPFRDEKNVLHIIGFPQHFTGKDILLQFGHLGDEIQRQGVRTVLKRVINFLITVA